MNNKIVNNTYKYQFTRHIQSCNNILSNLEALKKHKEPSATQYGILFTTLFSQEMPRNNNQIKRFTSKRVFVSNLLRTWITAFILYGMNFKNKFKNTQINNNNNHILELYVAPYLKEKKASVMGFSLETGNYPDKIKITLKKFYNFLNKYFKIVSLGNNIINHFPEKILLTIPPNPQSMNNKPQKIIFTKNGHGYTYNNCNLDIYDSIGPDCNNDGFLKDGDLNEFINWHKLKFRNNNSNTLIHIVTHSQIMFQYLENNQININNNKFNRYKKENCWSFLTDKEGKPIKYLYGVPEKKNIHPTQGFYKSDPKKLEKNSRKKNLSLCVYNNGKINNICTKNKN